MSAIDEVDVLVFDVDEVAEDATPTIQKSDNYIISCNVINFIVLNLWSVWTNSEVLTTSVIHVITLSVCYAFAILRRNYVMLLFY